MAEQNSLEGLVKTDVTSHQAKSYFSTPLTYLLNTY